MKMNGQLSHELVVDVPATDAWELYGSLKLVKVVEDGFKSLIEKTEVVEGDGDVGTVLELTFVQGTTVFSSYKEKFTKVDSKNYFKAAEVVEGGYLDLGFTLYRVTFEIIEKGEHACIIKSTVDYELKEESAANVSIVSIQPVAQIAEIAKNYLLKNKA